MDDLAVIAIVLGTLTAVTATLETLRPLAKVFLNRLLRLLGRSEPAEHQTLEIQTRAGETITINFGSLATEDIAKIERALDDVRETKKLVAT